MEQVPLADRVVEVIADRGERTNPAYQYGSGCIVHGRTVLTAAHLVSGARRVLVRGPNKDIHDATVDSRFVGDPDGPGPDLALIEMSLATRGLPPIDLAVVDRDSSDAAPIERCHAVGYPSFTEHTSQAAAAVRDTADAYGHVSVLSKLASGLLTLQVSSAPRPLPPADASLGKSEWSGMSGAPVVAEGCLLGVVIEHAPREGPSAITIAPLSMLEPDPAHPGWGPGVKDPFSWWVRLGAQGIDTLRLLPPRRVRSEPAYRATLREIRARTGHLVGRQRELVELATFATGPERYGWLVGGAWAGKTTLLAEAATAAMPEQVDVVTYFLSRREADADSNRFLAAVVPQLADLLGQDSPVADPHQFRALWQRAVEAAATAGRHLLLVVDGLDEDLRPVGSPSVAGLLPLLVGAHAHVLVSSRPYPELPDDVPVGHPLHAGPSMELEPFEGAAQLAALARQEIGDLLKRDDAGFAADTLGVLAAAGGPLAVEDLVALSASPSSPTPAPARQVRHVVTKDAARSLQVVGSTPRRYQFAHASLLEYAQTDDDLRDPQYQHRIHRWAEQWQAARWPVGPAPAPSTPRYLLDAYPRTLFGDPQRLASLVKDVGWIDAAIKSVGVDNVLADLGTAAMAAPQDPDVSCMVATVKGEANRLRMPGAGEEPSHAPRRLCLQAAELGEDALAAAFRDRLLARPEPGLVPLWTTRRTSPHLVVELADHVSVLAVAVLQDGRMVSGGMDGRLVVWDPHVPAARPVELGSHNGYVTAVAVLPDGRVASGDGEGRVLVWDPHIPAKGPVELDSHEARGTALAGLDARVSTLAVLPDGRMVSSGMDGRLLVWNPAAPRDWPVELHGQGGWMTALAVLPDGRLAGAHGGGQVLVWDPSTPGDAPVEIGRQVACFTTVAVLPDGLVVSSDAGEGRVLAWNPGLPRAEAVELGRHDAWVGALAVLPDGRVVSGGNDGRLLLWDPSLPEAGPVELGRHDGWVIAVAVLPDGLVVSAGNDKRLLLWRPGLPGEAPVQPGGYHGPVRQVAMMPDGRVVSGGKDGRLLVWEPDMPGKGPVELGRDDGPIRRVALMPDGRVVSVDCEGRLLVRDPDMPGAGPAEQGRDDGSVTAVAVLPDGRLVSIDVEGRMLVRDPDMPAKGPVELGRHDGGVEALAVLPDGRVVSVDAGHGRVLLWDQRVPGAEPVELGRHERWVSAVAALPDGRVVTGDSGGWLLVWDAGGPGAEPVKLGRHDGRVEALAVLPEGRVVSGGKGWVLVWDIQRRSVCASAFCSVTALVSGLVAPDESRLVVAHVGAGLSTWSIGVPPQDVASARDEGRPSQT